MPIRDQDGHRAMQAAGKAWNAIKTDPGLVPALKRLVQAATLGDPMRPLICPPLK
jgi:hypothetical protein